MTTLRRTAVALCLLDAALLVVLAVQHARALAVLGLGLAFQARDVAVFAVLTPLLAGTAALLDRAHRQGLRPRALLLLAGCALLLLAAVAAAHDPEQIAYGQGGLSGGGVYSSTLFLDFGPALAPGASVVVVLALGLLPVAGGAALLGQDRRLRLPRHWRRALLVVCALGAAAALVHLELRVALLDLLRGLPQELTALEAVAWVAGLWSLVGVALSARALRRPDVPRSAVLVPVAVLAAWGPLLLETDRRTCCFAYAPLDGGPLPEPPGVLPDLLVLGGCLLVGVVLPLGLQLLRVRTSASTPPG